MFRIIIIFFVIAVLAWVTISLENECLIKGVPLWELVLLKIRKEN